MISGRPYRPQLQPRGEDRLSAWFSPSVPGRRLDHPDPTLHPPPIRTRHPQRPQCSRTSPPRGLRSVVGADGPQSQIPGHNVRSMFPASAVPPISLLPPQPPAHPASGTVGRRIEVPEDPSPIETTNSRTSALRQVPCCSPRPMHCRQSHAGSVPPHSH